MAHFNIGITEIIIWNNTFFSSLSLQYIQINFLCQFELLSVTIFPFSADWIVQFVILIFFRHDFPTFEWLDHLEDSGILIGAYNLSLVQSAPFYRYSMKKVFYIDFRHFHESVLYQPFFNDCLNWTFSCSLEFLLHWHLLNFFLLWCMVSFRTFILDFLSSGSWADTLLFLFSSFSLSDLLSFVMVVWHREVLVIK